MSTTINKIEMAEYITRKIPHIIDSPAVFRDYYGLTPETPAHTITVNDFPSADYQIIILGNFRCTGQRWSNPTLERAYSMRYRKDKWTIIPMQRNQLLADRTPEEYAAVDKCIIDAAMTYLGGDNV